MDPRFAKSTQWAPMQRRNRWANQTYFTQFQFPIVHNETRTAQIPWPQGS